MYIATIITGPIINLLHPSYIPSFSSGEALDAVARHSDPHKDQDGESEDRRDRRALRRALDSNARAQSEHEVVTPGGGAGKGSAWRRGHAWAPGQECQKVHSASEKTRLTLLRCV